MKICFIAPAGNYHTKKWVDWFSAHGHEIHVVSFIDEQIDGATVHYIDTGADASGSDSSKLKYLLHAMDLKRVVKSICPDIINVHYASSYGTVAALAGIGPYVLSVWGSDIYEFPKKSPLHKKLLQFSLRKAKYLCSTSSAMAKEASQYTNRHFEITPFGVDMELFRPAQSAHSTDKFVVGTVKGLMPVYGIDHLLKAVSIIRNKYPELDIELRIAGKGPAQEEYKALAQDLGIDNLTKWLGFISQPDAAREWAEMDVAVVYSNQESFGVSAVEAQACGTALIVSDLPGLKEVTLPGKSSLVVPAGRPDLLADNIMTLYDNPEQRKSMAFAGREFVEDRFELNRCFRHIESLFSDIIKNGTRQ